MKLIETSIEYDGNMETKRLFIRSIKESDEIAFINGIADRQLRVAYGFQADMDSEISSRIFHRFCGLTGGFSIIEKASENMVGFLLDVNSIIHSYVWNLAYSEGKRGAAGFLTASDREKDKKLYFVTISDWIGYINYCKEKCNV